MFTLRAVVFRDCGAWIIQGVDLDIVARAADIADAPEAFAKALIQHAIITEELGRAPLEGNRRAPDRFLEMFEGAKTALSAVNGVTFPGLPVEGLEMRLASEADAWNVALRYFRQGAQGAP